MATTRAIAITRYGMAKKMSVIRMITSSSAPPKYPARTPRKIPMRRLAATTTTPMRNALRVPQTRP